MDYEDEILVADILGDVSLPLTDAERRERRNRYQAKRRLMRKDERVRQQNATAISSQTLPDLMDADDLSEQDQTDADSGPELGYMDDDSDPAFSEIGEVGGDRFDGYDIPNRYYFYLASASLKIFLYQKFHLWSFSLHIMTRK